MNARRVAKVWNSIRPHILMIFMSMLFTQELSVCGISQYFQSWAILTNDSYIVWVNDIFEMKYLFTDILKDKIE